MSKFQFLSSCLLLYLSGISISFAQSEYNLEQTIRTVSHAFKTQNYKEVQTYIHPEYGYIYWYRIGIPILQSYQRQSDFKFPTKDAVPPNIWFYQTPNPQQKLQKTTQLPQMQCEHWDKSGWYYQTTTQKPFTKVIDYDQKYEGISPQVSNQWREKVHVFEKNLVEMHYVGKSKIIGDDLYLYFSQIEGKWYLAAFDNAGDCDV